VSTRVRRNVGTPVIFEHTAWGHQYQDGILATRSTFYRPPLQSRVVHGCRLSGSCRAGSNLAACW